MSRLPTARCRAMRRWVLCCLLVAVPWYGVASTLTLLLGSAHFHLSRATPAGAPAAIELAGWQDFRRSADGHGGGLIASEAASSLGHAGLQRHHHGHADPGVVALDGTAGDDGAAGEGASAGAVVLVFALATGGPTVPAGMESATWRAAAPERVSSRPAERLERPPRG